MQTLLSLQPYGQMDKPFPFYPFYNVWSVVMPTIVVVSVIGMFVFLAIVVWSKQRRRERESFYQHELTRKIAEHGNIGEEKMLELFREQAAEDHRRRIEGQRVAGLINLAAGMGLLVALMFIERQTMFLGLIPFCVGVALLIASALPRPKP